MLGIPELGCRHTPVHAIALVRMQIQGTAQHPLDIKQQISGHAVQKRFQHPNQVSGSVRDQLLHMLSWGLTQHLLLPPVPPAPIEVPFLECSTT